MLFMNTKWNVVRCLHLYVCECVCKFKRTLKCLCLLFLAANLIYLQNVDVQNKLMNANLVKYTLLRYIIGIIFGMQPHSYWYRKKLKLFVHQYTTSNVMFDNSSKLH